MPWWKSTNSPSSSSSPRRNRNESPAIFSRRGSGDSSAQPRLTRQRKLRHLTNIDVAGASSASFPVTTSPTNLDVTPLRSSSSPVLLPQPLPLPGNSPQSPNRRELRFLSGGCRLPSPREGSGGDEGCWSSDSVACRLTYQAALKSPEHVDAPAGKSMFSDYRKALHDPNSVETEIEVLSQLKHPNIVQYYGSEMTEDRFFIYLEYVFPGSIDKYVRDHCGAMTESVVRNFTRHILRGLAYLHGSKKIHRDIKGANLLVDINGVVKLADFGMAKHLSGVAGALSLKGTPYWMAPEVVQATMNKDVGYDYAVDIWSLGCTIIEMFTRKHPWSGLEGAAAMFKVLHKDPPIPDTLSSEGKDFLRRCFCRNPADRPTATMLLDHPFIRNLQHHKIHGSIQDFARIKIIVILVSLLSLYDLRCLKVLNTLLYLITGEHI
ncbi:uncharacterized protein A4U43_C07F29400 [Asparagus officinalis]|uniref:Protein kinase domain-containing protein n=1 Tax=Asparagus officinalis TaxID=4686 RepID=A0A5P1EFW2_ASPOF|nr:uncharacterized protein A4U43_C07F29400 [Asparagus officinalis]